MIKYLKSCFCKHKWVFRYWNPKGGAISECAKCGAMKIEAIDGVPRIKI